MTRPTIHDLTEPQKRLRTLDNVDVDVTGILADATSKKHVDATFTGQLRGMLEDSACDIIQFSDLVLRPSFVDAFPQPRFRVTRKGRRGDVHVWHVAPTDDVVRSASYFYGSPRLPKLCRRMYAMAAWTNAGTVLTPLLAMACAGGKMHFRGQPIIDAKVAFADAQAPVVATMSLEEVVSPLSWMMPVLDLYFRTGSQWWRLSITPEETMRDSGGGAVCNACGDSPPDPTSAIDADTIVFRAYQKADVQMRMLFDTIRDRLHVG